MDPYEEKSNVYAGYFREKNFFEEPHQTVFVGDSLTARCDLEKYYGFGVNRGISGDAFRWVFRRLDCSVYDLRPDLVVFMMGVNDLNFYRATKEDVLGWYERLMTDFDKKLRAPALFLSLCPVIEGAGSFVVVDGLNATIDAINEELPALCKKHGYAYLNIHDLLTDEKGGLDFAYAHDNVHLNDFGYRRITERIAREIPVVKRAWAEKEKGKKAGDRCAENNENRVSEYRNDENGSPIADNGASFARAGKRGEEGI